MASQEIRGEQIRDQSIKRVDIELNFNDDGALRAQDIPYSALSSIKTQIDSLATISNSLNNLTDVIISSASTGQYLKYNGSNWVNDTFTLSDGIVTSSKISANAVVTGKINTNAVTSDKIATNAVVSSKIADDSVTYNKIKDGTASKQVLKYNGSAWIASQETLNDIKNVVISSGVTTGQILKYNGTNWVNSSGGGGASVLNDLTDVTISTPVSGQVLKWNGSQWVNSSGGSSVGTLDDLTDVVITSVMSGDVLQYNGSQWINSNAATKGLAAKRQIFTSITSATLSVDLDFVPWSLNTAQLILNSEVMTYGAAYDWRMSTNGKRVLLSSGLRPLISTGDYIEARYWVAETDTMGMVGPRADRFTSADISNAQISFSLSGKPINANAIQVDVNGIVLHQNTHWVLSSDGTTLLVNGYTLSTSDEMQVKYLEGQENYAITEGAYVFFKQERLTMDAGLISANMSQYPATISSVNVWRNGIFEENGVDYDVVGKKVVFSGQISADDIVVALYGKYQSAMRAINERPSGAINGVNKSYTLTNNPVGKEAVVLFHNGVFQEMQTVYSSVWAGKDYRVSGINTLVMSAAPSTGILAAYYYTAEPDLISTIQDGIFDHIYLRDTVSTANIYKMIVSAGTLTVSRA